MRVRFRTSIAGATFSYLEGQTRDLPSPPPAIFREWIRQGICELVKPPEEEVALAPDVIERAVARRTTAARRRAPRAAPAAGSEDD